MDIIYLGHSSFKLSSKTGSVVTDPYDSAMVGFKFPKVTSDIVTISHDHADHNKSELVEGVKRIIDGPGEYEIAGISVIGFPSYHDNKKGEERGKNTIYVFEIDGIRLCHLGDLGHKLADEMIDDIGHIDILMLPVGGEFTIDAGAAVEVVSDIEPEIVIPMHYLTQGVNPEVFSKLLPLDDFLKDIGWTTERSDKLSVKKEDLGQTEKVVVLSKK